MNRFVAEFRYNDIEVTHTLWSFSNMVTETELYKPKDIKECSIALLIDKVDQCLTILSKFRTENSEVTEFHLARLPKGKYNLRKLVNAFCILRKAGSDFCQAEFRLGLRLGVIRNLLNEFGVGHTVRYRRGSVWYPAVRPGTLNKNLDWIMSYNSKLEEVVIWASEPDKMYQVSLEPNKFKKGWRISMLQALASIISKSYSSG